MSSVVPQFDLLGFLNMLVQVFQQFSAMSGGLGNFIQQYWTQLLEQLPPATILWFTLATYLGVAYSLSSLTARVCKYLTLLFTVIFLILFIKEKLGT